MKNVELTKVKGNANANYYVGEVKKSFAVNVEFDDGSSNKYAGDNKLNKGDIFVVGSGCKSSYAMGTVNEVTSSRKTTYLAKSAIVFKKDPTKADINACFNGIKLLQDKNEIVYSCLPEYVEDLVLLDKSVVVTDFYVSNVLRALSVLTYPELATSNMVKKSETLLAKEKSLPQLLLKGLNKCFCEGFVMLGFSGYYPGWKDEIKNLSIWSNEEIQKVDVLCDDEEDGLLVNCYKANDNIKKAYQGDKEFCKFFNRLVYLSAFAVLIRGNIVNLLKTALSVKMPINDFYDDIVELAKTYESEECYKLLKDTDYKNKKFETKVTKAKEEPIKKVVNIPKDPDFVIDGVTLEKYKGNSEVVTIPEGIEIIDRIAFYGNTSIKKIIMPDTVKSIKNGAMECCKNLEEVIFSKNLSSIGREAFRNCKLKNVDLSDTKVKTLPYGAFMNCNNINNLILPKQLKKISDDALYGVYLERLDIPASIEKIEYKTSLDNVWYAKDIYFEGDYIESVDFIKNITRKELVTIHCKKDGVIWKKVESKVKTQIENNKRYLGLYHELKVELIACN